MKPQGLPVEHRVLVIDGDRESRLGVTQLLEGTGFEVTVVDDGPAAAAAIDRARARNSPFALAVVDRETIRGESRAIVHRLWTHDPDLQVLLCKDGEPELGELECYDQPDALLLLLQKPFSPTELLLCARALTRKWALGQQARMRVESLNRDVLRRAAELEIANSKLAAELAWRTAMEARMRVTQRLEAIGQISAGVAHEINSPIQYVGDNAEFLRDVTADLMKLVDHLHATRTTLPASVQEQLAALDVEFLRVEVPSAVESITVGVRRIASIVAALKQLSHPGSTEAREADINGAIEHALEISASSYRTVARVDKELAALPDVVCHVSELGQVFLNLIINASHAMKSSESGRGVLGIRTSMEGEHIVVSISDTGCGIPEAIRERIFDPFFTTKDPGVGTGQGLAIARSIIVDRHGGDLQMESTVGVGTTFHVRIPIHRQRGSVAAAS